jgi:ribonuclease HI
MKKKWYVVLKGKVPEVYDDWDDCLAQVNECSGNSYKGYKTKEEAEAR